MFFVILGIVMVTLLYMCGALVTIDKLFTFDVYDLDLNPLWKIPVFIFWPIAWVVVLVSLWLCNYIEEIIDWYEEHDRKEEEE